MRRIAWSGVALLGSLLILACEPRQKSAAGFHLPDGDPVAGKAAFVELKCSACHGVHGIVDLPAPVANPPVPVTLGGPTPIARTDGELVAALVDPSHRLAPGYPPERVQSGRRSRMGDFADAMTVRQLIDLVAFLQAQYKVVPPTPVH